MKRKILHCVLALGVSSVTVLAQKAPSSGAATEQNAPSTDSEMTTKVRQALMNDNTVGTAAQHIRVTTKNGVVTLKGKVESDQERDEALAKAKQVAGDANVKDEITVSKK